MNRINPARPTVRLETLLEPPLDTYYLEALNDPAITKFTEARHKSWSQSDLADYVAQHINSREQRLFAIHAVQDARHIGNLRIFNISGIHKRCELAFLLFSQRDFGMGYMTDAVQIACRFAFEELGLHRVSADYYESNRASARVFEKNGFVIEGRFRDWFRMGDGSYSDSIRVGLLARDLRYK